jgi:putative PIN family toxin of toxin-antitoxin system
MRIVLDTDVMAAAMRSDRGASRQLLLAALDRRVVVLASVPLMLEYEAVLTRPEHLAEISLTAGEAGEVLDAVASVAEPVLLRFLWRPQLRDPDDEMVLETAVNGGAQRLATFNVRHLGPAAQRFGIGAARPGVIWREIQGREHEKK